MTNSNPDALTLALVQTPTHWQDWAANRAMFDSLLSEVPESTDLVLLPEMFTSGFTMDSQIVAQPMQGPAVHWLQEAASRCGAVLCGSLVVTEAGQYYNRFVWISPTGEVQHYDKRHRFRMAGEHEHYAAGHLRPVIQLGRWRVLPSVCYDLRFPVWLRNQPADAYDLFLCVANWPAARQTAWDTLLRARAIENQCYAAGVNILGVDGNEVTYQGGSAVIGPTGEERLVCHSDAGVFSVEISLTELENQRRQFPVWQDADSYELKPEEE